MNTSPDTNADPAEEACRKCGRTDAGCRYVSVTGGWACTVKGTHLDRELLEQLDRRDRLKKGLRDEYREMNDEREFGRPPPVSASAASCGPPAPPAVPEYVPFPVECLPERVREFVRAVAESTNTDPAFTALPLLSLLGAAVGTTRAVSVKRGWKAYPSVWGCAVGRSASGKSPPLAALNEAVHPLVDDLEDENKEVLDEYHEAKARHLADRSKKGLPPPLEPSAKRIRVGDVTVEALAGILHANPRGVWLVADELAGWLGSFTRYSGGKGNTDRPKWLSLFDGGFLEVDRRTTEPKHLAIRNTLVGIAGGIQPGILRAAMTEENVDSGLFARILVAFPPDRLTQWTEQDIPEELTADLTVLLRDLRRYDFATADGRRVPQVRGVTLEAKALWVPFYNANRQQAFAGDDAEAASQVKLESYALKFALLRHLCRHAGGDDSTPVSAQDMEAGIRLAGWFLHELHRVRAMLAEPEQMQGQRRLVAWIRDQGGEVTVRQLQRSNSRRYHDETAARVRLEQLAASGFGEWEARRAANNKSVDWFVLRPTHDARHCTTLTPDSPDQPHDTAPDAADHISSQPVAGQGSSSSASCSVVRRASPQPQAATEYPQPTASGAASCIPTDDPLDFPFGHNAQQGHLIDPSQNLPD